jgi:hypothetical protein
MTGVTGKARLERLRSLDRRVKVWTGEMKMARRGVRSCSALSGSGYHRYGAHL